MKISFCKCSVTAIYANNEYKITVSNHVAESKNFDCKNKGGQEVIVMNKPFLLHYQHGYILYFEQFQ